MSDTELKFYTWYKLEIGTFSLNKLRIEITRILYDTKESQL